MIKRRWLNAVWALLLALIGFGIGTYLSGSFNTASAETILSISDRNTMLNFDRFRELEAKLDKSIRQEGWLRYSYQQYLAESNPYFSSSAQMPLQAQFEMWFHFNAEGLVDQQVTFLINEEKKVPTEIFKNGIYRSVAENFQPIDQSPYSPSFYFYLTREDPQAALEEGVRLRISANFLEEDSVMIIQIYRSFEGNSKFQNAPSQSMKHVLWVDADSGRPLKMENYQVQPNGGLQLVQSITQIDFSHFDELPVEVEKVFGEESFH